MIVKTEKNSVVSLVLVSSLLLLTGCFGEKAKDVQSGDAINTPAKPVVDMPKGDVLLSINGNPVLYAEDFEDQKQMAQQSNQQLNMILQMMPDAEYSMLFKSIQAGHLMKEWVVRSGIDQKPENVKQRRQYHEAIDLQLYMKYYEDAHPIHVSEHEAKAFYHAKKDQIPGLIISPAGIEILYASFDDKEQAEAFAAKVRDGSEKHMKLAAKEIGVTLASMNVSSDSQVSESLKNSVLSATKFPSKIVVKVDENAYWVIGMISKKEAEYRSFDMPEVKQGITKMCRDEKREVELSKEIEKLNKEYNVVENVAYFENKKQNKNKALLKAEEIVMQAQQQATEELEDALLEDKI